MPRSWSRPRAARAEESAHYVLEELERLGFINPALEEAVA